MKIKILLAITALVFGQNMYAAFCKMSQLGQRMGSLQLAKNNRSFGQRINLARQIIDNPKRFYSQNQVGLPEASTKQLDAKEFNLIKDKLAQSLFEYKQNKNKENLENFRKILGQMELPFEQQFQLLMTVLEKSNEKEAKEINRLIIAWIVGSLAGFWLTSTYFNEIDAGINILEKKAHEWKKRIITEPEK